MTHRKTKREKQNENQRKQYKANNRMADLSLNISVITINVIIT